MRLLVELMPAELVRENQERAKATEERIATEGVRPGPTVKIVLD